MKILQINSVCGVGSTGRIAADLHAFLTENGEESRVAFGRSETHVSCGTHRCDAVMRIGNLWDNYRHVAKTRLLDRHGFGSRGATRRFLREVEAFAPDVLILVDYPGFNMKMARWAKEHGIRVFYYIAPKVWAWREWRVKAIRKYVDELFIIFPFERDYFPKHGIRPIFEGNPLVDAIEARRASLPSPDEFRRRHALDERPIVALLAGSRRSEIKANLPLMADLARKFPDRQFVVTGVSWLDRSIYEQYIADSGIRYVCDQTYETLAAAEAAVVTSGTATLETALLNVPEVVVYRTLWFQVKLQPYVLKVPYVSLVNLNLGRESVVEIIQSDLDITRAERELRAILTGGEKRERMLRDFAELQAVIGAPGASDRFAARMVELLKKQVR